MNRYALLNDPVKDEQCPVVVTEQLENGGPNSSLVNIVRVLARFPDTNSATEYVEFLESK